MSPLSGHGLQTPKQRLSPASGKPVTSRKQTQRGAGEMLMRGGKAVLFCLLDAGEPRLALGGDSTEQGPSRPSISAAPSSCPGTQAAPVILTALIITWNASTSRRN